MVTRKGDKVIRQRRKVGVWWFLLEGLIDMELDEDESASIRGQLIGFDDEEDYADVELSQKAANMIEDVIAGFEE